MKNVTQYGDKRVSDMIIGWAGNCSVASPEHKH